MTSDCPPCPRRTTLFVTPEGGQGATSACLHAAAGTDPNTRDVLMITHDRTPEALIDAWRTRVQARPNNFGVVAVGDSMRSATEAASAESGTTRNVVETVAEPEDLQGTRDLIEEFVDAWKTTGNRTVVYFDSVGTFVRTVDLESAMEFLEELIDVLGTRDCLGYFRYDVRDDEDDMIPRLESMFDRVQRVTSTSDADPGSQNRPGLDRESRSLSMDAVFDLFSVSRRRLVLFQLWRSGGPVSIEVLANRIARTENGFAAEEALTRAYVALRHVHLPKLEDAGLISVDWSRNTVEPDPEVLDRLEPVLAFAAAEEGIDERER